MLCLRNQLFLIILSDSVVRLLCHSAHIFNPWVSIYILGPGASVHGTRFARMYHPIIELPKSLYCEKKHENNNRKLNEIEIIGNHLNPCFCKHACIFFFPFQSPPAVRTPAPYFVLYTYSYSMKSMQRKQTAPNAQRQNRFRNSIVYMNSRMRNKTGAPFL